ncbi:MAG: cupin [Oscillospiraceae bacterium]|nr:cupin [Oscillospiraceae bacterium]MBR0392484.1 cupin [Oscillospiraceae bacterium]
MKPEIFENNAEGIKVVYKNDEWSVSIKNWKPDNDIAGVEKLEIHHTSDEQFVLVAGKALLITADEKDGVFVNIELTPMEIGKVAHVGKEQWFYSITQKDSKIVYVQRADCSMDNSEIKYMTPAQVKAVQEEAKKLLAL